MSSFLSSLSEPSLAFLPFLDAAAAAAAALLALSFSFARLVKKSKRRVRLTG
jgi:hypothetical protein